MQNSYIPIDDIKICTGRNGLPKIIGDGGCGEVFLGVVRMSQPAAIKVVLGGGPGRQARLVREVFHLHMCHHPNIIQFYGYSFEGPKLLLLMEYASGGSLHSVMRTRSDGISWHSGGRKIAREICAGLIYLHSIGIAHLDIKSPNILLTATGAKIADVGLGKIVHLENPQTATSPGTPLWAAPEQLFGGQCGFFSDMWSFGTVMWELCMGQSPQRRPLQPLPEGCAPPSIAALIVRCRNEEGSARPTALQAFEVIDAST